MSTSPQIDERTRLEPHAPISIHTRNLSPPDPAASSSHPPPAPLGSSFGWRKLSSMGTAAATFRGDAQLCVGGGMEEQLVADDYDAAWMLDEDDSLKLVASRRIVFKLARPPPNFTRCPMHPLEWELSRHGFSLHPVSTRPNRRISLWWCVKKPPKQFNWIFLGIYSRKSQCLAEAGRELIVDACKVEMHKA